MHSNNLSVDNCLFQSLDSPEMDTIAALFNVRLVITNTNFSRISGNSVLYVEKNIYLLLRNCRFEHNHAKKAKCGIAAYERATVIIERCHFENNSSPFNGILIAKVSVNIKISESTIIRNKVIYDHLIDVGIRSSLVISSSSFSNNIGGNIINIDTNSTLKITNSSFVNHSLLVDPLIQVVANTQLTLQNNLFSNNSQHKEGIFLLKMNSTANVLNCLFIKSSSSKGGVFYLIENSEMAVKNCIFKDNFAGDASLAYLDLSRATFINITATNGRSLFYGGMIAAYYSKVFLYNSHLSYGSSMEGGCIMLQQYSSLAAHNCIFENSSAESGGAIFKYGRGNVYLENCTLRNNSGLLGGSICIYNGEYLRMSRGFCQVLPNSSCVTFKINFLFKHHSVHFYTHNITIKKQNVTVNSRTDRTFKSDILKYYMITGWTRCIWQETPYASCK